MVIFWEGQTDRHRRDKEIERKGDKALVLHSWTLLESR